MSNIASLALLLSVTISQLSAAWCPMGTTSATDGDAEMVVVSGTPHDESEAEHPHPSHDESESRHGDHEDGDACLILMACGSIAAVRQTTWIPALSPSGPLFEVRLPSQPDSVDTDLELPPPRRV